MNQVQSIAYGEGKFLVSGVCVRAGEDLAVTLLGGEKSHIGAVAVAQEAQNAATRAKTVSVSVICLPGHKEDELARAAALRLSRALGNSVSVSVGIHVNNASQADIQQLLDNTHHVLERIERCFAGERGSKAAL
jgi:Tat protein secretion system quality control protein TatD with DNase activity